MSGNRIDTKTRFELIKFLQDLKKARENLPKPRISDTALSILASEHFGRHLSPSHIRTAKALMGDVKIKQRPAVSEEPMIERRKTTKRTFKCECGRMFTVRIQRHRGGR